MPRAHPDANRTQFHLHNTNDHLEQVHQLRQHPGPIQIAIYGVPSPEGGSNCAKWRKRQILHERVLRQLFVYIWNACTLASKNSLLS